MNKEKILEKSRKERNTEYEEKVYQKGYGYGIALTLVLCLIFMLSKIIVSDIRGLKEVLPFFDIVIIGATISSFNSLYLYSKLKDKKFLFLGLFLIPFIIAFTYKYIITI
ncbi:DUF6442 family protein [Miniphocaeibacter massiliensis]|uniref:DUF6442 family protein n=1 Tax=Miniphocaeibacter massiliensis TaxID=2041841 RepID=UPI000C1BDA3B|nr:DUF6442 family protein [Miniphocaeibacter massiliensis]